QEKRNGHEAAGPGIALMHADEPQGKPVDAEQGSEYSRRIERCAFEGMKPAEADQDVASGDELAEPRHPHSPQAICEINSLVPCREAQQFLWAENQIACPQAEK